MNDVQCTDTSSEGQADGDEICSICLDVYDNPVQLSCGHSFCEVCLDGWHKKSKYDEHQPRNCPMCRHRAKPSKEIIAKLFAHSVAVKTSKEKDESYIRSKAKLQELVVNLKKMGHTTSEIADMLKEYDVSQNLVPDFIVGAMRKDDVQTIIDWLGSPIDDGKLTSLAMGRRSMLHVAATYEKKELASLLLQYGVAVNVYDSLGTTPILSALLQSDGLANETATLLYEWGASLQHHLPGKDGAAIDAFLQTSPMFQNELVKSRCEIINLNQRKDLIGQTCIVEKFIAKKNRYKVTTEHARETFLVGRDNLKRRDRTPGDPGYYITFKDGDYKRHTFASNEECQEFVRNLAAGRECD